MMSKDWTGGNASVFITNGATGHADHEREQHDYYATDPKAAKLLLDLEKFSDTVYEPACGEGHIGKVLEAEGYKVIASDLINRGYGKGGIDFLQTTETNLDVDIITNPPYKYALDFVKHSLDIITDGHKVAMFLKLTFLEGKNRKTFFEQFPPKVVYVSSSRIECAMNGNFTGASATAYAWFVWEKGYKGDTVIKWFN